MKHWEPKDWMVAFLVFLLSACGTLGMSAMSWKTSIDSRVDKLEQAFMDVHEIVMRLDGK